MRQIREEDSVKIFQPFIYTSQKKLHSPQPPPLSHSPTLTHDTYLPHSLQQLCPERFWLCYFGLLNVIEGGGRGEGRGFNVGSVGLRKGQVSLVCGTVGQIGGEYDTKCWDCWKRGCYTPTPFL